MRELVRRHEGLRTGFEARDGVPVQRVRSAVSVDLPVVEVAGATAEDRERKLARPAARGLAAVVRSRPGAAAPGEMPPSGRARARAAAGVHHIVSDGWSMGVIAHGSSALYSAVRHRRDNALPPLPIQFADYTSWQRDGSRATAETLLRYWRGRLAGLEPLEFPTNRPRPARASYAGRVERFTVAADLLEGLKALARGHNTTLFTLLLAAFKVLLMRYTRQEDLAVGSPVAGRERPSWKG